jgi:hypothetical protein
MREEQRPRSQRVFRVGHAVSGLMVAALGAASHVAAPGTVQAWIATGVHCALGGLIVWTGLSAQEEGAWQGMGLRGRIPEGAGYSNVSACWGLIGGGLLAYALLWVVAALYVAMVHPAAGVVVLVVALLLGAAGLWVLRWSRAYIDRIGPGR